MAIDAGAATLSVKLISNAASITTESATLEDSVLLDVVAELRVLSSSKLLLPFHTQSNIITSRDGATGLSYTVHISTSARRSADSELHVSSSGVITTGSTPLVAVVFITESFKGFNQTVAVFVEVWG